MSDTYNTTIYKACRRVPDSILTSAVCRDPRLLINYLEGEWTQPIVPGTPLLAFISWRAAAQWASVALWPLNHEIWRAEGMVDWDWNLQRRGLISPATLSTEAIQRFWNDPAVDSVDWLYLPHGTVLCRQLKLTERLL